MRCRSGGIAADGRLDPAADRRRVAAHQGEVLLGDRAVAELAHQARLRVIGLGHQQEAGGVLVEPMHDARSLHAGDAAQHLVARAGRPSSAWTRVPVACPALGCTTRPAGLSTMSIVASSYAMRSGMSSGTSVSSGGAESSTLIRSPPARRSLARARRPSTSARPSEMRRWAWARLMPATATTDRSNRPAVASPSTSRVSATGPAHVELPCGSRRRRSPPPG